MKNVCCVSVVIGISFLFLFCSFLKPGRTLGVVDKKKLKLMVADGFMLADTIYIEFLDSSNTELEKFVFIDGFETDSLSKSSKSLLENCVLQSLHTVKKFTVDTIPSLPATYSYRFTFSFPDSIVSSDPEKCVPLSFLFYPDNTSWSFLYKEKFVSGASRSDSNGLIEILNEYFEQKITVKEKVDSLFLRQLGDEFFTEIVNVDSVNVFFLDPRITPSDNIHSYNGYKVAKNSFLLTDSSVEALKKILADPASYPLVPYRKMCTFIPEVGFRFYKNDLIILDLMISSYCEEWMLIYKGERFIREYENAGMELDAILKEIF